MPLLRNTVEEPDAITAGAVESTHHGPDLTIPAMPKFKMDRTQFWKLLSLASATLREAWDWFNSAGFDFHS